MKKRSPKRNVRGGTRRAPRRGREPARKLRRAFAHPAAAGRIESLRRQIEKAAAAPPARWNANPEDVRRSVLKLVLTLVEMIRQLLERQAIRRMEAGTLTSDQTESVGLALMRLQETILDLAGQFNISPDELNLDLGPVGKAL
jgi:Gas vesicle protein K